MKFGLFNLMSYRDNPGGLPGVMSDMDTMVGIAEDIGFDVAWFAEHHFTNYSVSVSPLVMAGFIAGRRRKIRVGAAVVVLPLYQPLRIAQEIALVDQLSEGRFVLGVGTGYQPYEFDRYGVKVENKTDIFLDYWEVLEQALMTGHVNHRGPYVDLPETVVLLKTRSGGMPPLFVTSVDPRVLKRLAKHNPVPFLTAGWRGTEVLYGMAEHARGNWQTAGLGAMPIAVQQYIHVTDSKAEALEAAERARFVARMVAAFRSPDVALAGGSMVVPPPLPDEPPLEVFRDNLLIGDPHLVAEKLIAEIRRLGMTHYNSFFQFGDMPIARAAKSLSRFGAEVLPLVEKELGPLDAIGTPAAAAA